METKENLHQGHRARMMDKFLNYPESLLDHELLEVLLFGFIPRVDTNKIAHNLLKTFGSLEVLFSASGKEIMSVEGVGKATASHIKSIGEIYKRILQRERNCNPKMQTIGQAKEKVIASFEKHHHEEVLKVFLLDKKHNIITSVTFDNKRFDAVSISIPEIAKVIALHKPAFTILAHNHPSDNLEPSSHDDLATKRIKVLCDIHGATLVDHFIVSKNKVYSYYENNRLESIIGNNTHRIFNLEEFK